MTKGTTVIVCRIRSAEYGGTTDVNLPFNLTPPPKKKKKKSFQLNLSDRHSIESVRLLDSNHVLKSNIHQVCYFSGTLPSPFEKQLT